MKKIYILFILLPVSVVVSAFDFMRDGNYDNILSEEFNTFEVTSGYGQSELVSMYSGDEGENGGGNNNVNLVDGEPFTNDAPRDGVNISYTRNFTNTRWQALYIPFSVRYEDLKDNFEVAEILNFHDYDNDDDGVVDETWLEILKMKDGTTIKPNCPYLIRAKQKGTKTITVKNTTLYKAEENSINCASTKATYIFTGTYQGVSGRDMIDNSYYALSGGQLKQASSEEASLGTFRWYLKIERREYSNYHFDHSREMVISIKEIDEDDDTEISGVTAIASDYKHSTEYYQLNGTRVSNPTSSGIFIVKDSDGNIKKIIKNRR